MVCDDTLAVAPPNRTMAVKIAPLIALMALLHFRDVRVMLEINQTAASVELGHCRRNFGRKRTFIARGIKFRNNVKVGRTGNNCGIGITQFALR